MRGGHGIEVLIRWIVRLAIWHLVFRVLGGFLTRYTHIPWLGTLVLVILVFVLARLALRWYRNRRP